MPPLIYLATLLLVVACSGTALPAGGRISTDPLRGALVDEDGRQRIFHGTNIVYKGYPYAPPMLPIDANTSFGDEDMDRIASWGMNNVRLGLMWAGAEPTKGVYNKTYLKQLRGIADALGKRGIYTYVELHQDVLAERFCGDGIPTWAIEDNISQNFPKPVVGFGQYSVEADGLPSEEDCHRSNWANYYASDAVGKAFQAIYDNKNGVGDRVASLWQEVASTFKGCPWLLGYELMNEPWSGDHWSNPSIVYPGVADKTNLAPFYATMAAAIRDVDKDHLIMFEPIPWDNWVPAGFDESPLSSDMSNKSVFAYHYYRPPDMISAQDYFSIRTSDAKRLKSAGFLTEFATTWDNPDKTAPQHDLGITKETISLAENFTQSWSGWGYKLFYSSSRRHPMTPGTFSMFFPNGSLDMELVSALSRPYARAVAGTIVHNRFTVGAKGSIWQQAVSSSYVLEYDATSRCTLPTEVYVDADMHFPQGFTMTVTPSENAVARYDASHKLLHVSHGPGIQDGERVRVVIQEILSGDGSDDQFVV